jgi:hypothetical protein
LFLELQVVCIYSPSTVQISLWLAHQKSLAGVFEIEHKEKEIA